MTRSRLISLPALIGSLLLVGAGCVSFSSGDTAGTGDGGIFKTDNKGDNWVQKSAIATVSGEKRSFNGASVTVIVQDPQDSNALYVGTAENGMFYTYDGGESWMQPNELSRGRIPSIAVDPKDKCTVYVAAENKLLKTADCSRSWSVPFLDTRTDKKTTAVAVDAYNSSIIWLATSSGDLLRSSDAGFSWSNVRNFDNDQILELAISPLDTRRVFVATKSRGIWRTVDGGAEWTDLSKNYESFPSSREYSDLAVGLSEPQTLVMASKYGLLRSKDDGDTWDKIDLLTPPGSTVIYSVAIDPKDASSLYYGTSTTFYRSSNGGVNWIPKKLPTTRAATSLLVDRANSSVLYLGVTKFKK